MKFAWPIAEAWLWLPGLAAVLINTLGLGVCLLPLWSVLSAGILPGRFQLGISCLVTSWADISDAILHVARASLFIFSNITCCKRVMLAGCTYANVILYPGRQVPIGFFQDKQIFVILTCGNILLCIYFSCVVILYIYVYFFAKQCSWIFNNCCGAWRHVC